MARPYTWLPLVPKVLKRVEASARTHYTREDLGGMFGVKSRTAATILGLMNTVTAGTSVLVTREALLQFLRKFAEHAEPETLLGEEKAATGKRKAQTKERERQAQKVRISRQLAKRQPVDWSRVKSFLGGDESVVTPAGVPENIELAMGAVTIHFRYYMELIEGLAWLAGYHQDGQTRPVLEQLCMPEPGAPSTDERQQWLEEKADSDRISADMAYFDKYGRFPDDGEQS